MASAPQDQKFGEISTDFGANDWLIDEMREKFTADPGSVDPAWVAYFNGAATPASPTVTSTPVVPSKPAPVPTAVPATSHPVVPATKPVVVPEALTEPTPAKTGSAPEGPGSGRGVSPDLPRQQPVVSKEPAAPTRTPLRGAPLRTATNMDASLAMPTATSVRDVPMKLAIDQRQIINAHLARSTGGKISFTHLIGWAMIQALKAVPEMNNSYDVTEGKPTLVAPPSINLGLAIDMKKPDGTRQLLVPNIKNCDDLNFAQFWAAYEALVRKARDNTLTVADSAGTTASLTNPGGLGTNHSVPRLMSGQGMILGVGSIDYPPEFQGASTARINQLGVSKVTTLTST